MLHLNTGVGTALYKQLYEQIRDHILSGAMPAGMRLPSIRALSGELKTSKNTVESAYSQLVLEGYIEALPCSGYTVNPVQHELNPLGTARAGSARAGVAKEAAERESRVPTDRISYDFHYGNLDASTFPYAIWRKLLADILKEAGGARQASNGMHVYGDAYGHASLRRELAKYLYRSRGVQCSAGQVVICSGLQASIIAILQLVRQESGEVALEDPTYNGAKVVYECFQSNVIPIPVEHDGINVRLLKDSGAKLVHITPSHQFPTGAVMPAGKRMEILNWAAQNSSWIIEDDYDSELRYSGRPIPSLQSMDRHGRVIYLGTFSKALSPGLRMSYMVLPVALADRFRTVFDGFQCSVPWLEQAVLSRFMSEGHWDRHLRRICLAKKKKHDVFVNAVNQLFGNAIRISGHNAGLHLLLGLPEGSDEASFIASAAMHGVRVYPASPFWTDKSRYPGSCLFIGYGMLSGDEIVAALKTLKHAWTSAGCLAGHTGQGSAH